MIHEDVTECATFRQLYQPQKYSNRVLRAVRQQLGYDEDNVAADTEINAMSRHEVFDRWLRWEGIIGYHVRLISVIEDIYKVKLEPSDD
jgi:hypothetical protein